MKKILLSLSFLLSVSCLLLAQNSLQLTLNHNLGSEAFALNQGAQNNLANDFKVERLQYYISEISVFDVDDNEMVIPDTWVLVDASSGTVVDLGEYTPAEVSKVKFHIGVDEDHNHLDPASYAARHPLAPKSPSMHWGWTPGYRFVAMEGKGGPSLDQTFELHGLGDANYFSIEIPVTAVAENGVINIEVDADYTRALEGINVSAGLISHAESGSAKQCLENFRDYTFTASGTSSSIDFSEVERFDVSPNPSTGQAFINLESSQSIGYTIMVTDVLGQVVRSYTDVSTQSTLQFASSTPGVYFVSLIKKGQPVIVRKLVSQ